MVCAMCLCGWAGVYVSAEQVNCGWWTVSREVINTYLSAFLYCHVCVTFLIKKRIPQRVAVGTGTSGLNFHWDLCTWLRVAGSLSPPSGWHLAGEKLPRLAVAA
jgi:hypothetical protein